MKYTIKQLLNLPSWHEIILENPLISDKNQPNKFLDELQNNSDYKDNIGKFELFETGLIAVEQWNKLIWDTFPNEKIQRLLVPINNEVYEVEIELVKRIYGKSSIVSTDRIFEIRFNLTGDTLKQWNKLFSVRQTVSILRGIFLVSNEKTFIQNKVHDKKIITYQKYIISIFDKAKKKDDLTDISAGLLSNKDILTKLIQ
ncbi:MAG: hypothetical protein LBV67_10375 [Streptococcaceae bacterium]|jgi:hypothetical protein|nr:hypothetical protein [Streptococcaceae bacterium]